MADVSTVTMPDGSVKVIKDSISRSSVYELVDSGAKNIFPVRFTSKAATASNPSCTNNGDGTITVNGSRVGNDTIMAYDLSSDLTASTDTRYTLPSGKYVVSGSTVTNARIQVYCHDGTNFYALATSMKSAPEFNYTSELKTTHPYIVWRLFIQGSSTFNNVKLYPMICTKAAWDISQAYVPYRPSEDEQNAQIATNTSAIADIFGLPSTSIAPKSGETDDFNNYMIGGRYKVTSSTYGARIQNNPYTASGGVLKVEIIQSENYVRQEYYVQAHPESLYVRHYRYTNGWTNWFVFTAAEIIPST